MHQPKKWWIGLPVLAGVIFFAAQSLTPQIEATLKEKVAARLSLDPAKVAVVGRDVAIAGAAPGAKEIAALRADYGVRRINAIEDAPPAASSSPPSPSSSPPPREPYIFSATLGESLIALDGKLPDDALQKRAVLLAAAAGSGLAVSDGTKIDAASPSGDFAAALELALDALRRLSSGKVSLTDGRLTIEGEGRENIRAETLTIELKARMPEGFELAKVEVAPGPVSPYVFQALREGYKTILAGFAPDEATRNRIVEGARRRFFDSIVEDQLAIAKGAPDKFADAAGAGLAALARMDSGNLSLSDATASLSGAARFEGARDEIEKTFESGLPKGFAGETRLVSRTLGAPLDAAGCRAAFAELSKTPIRFDASDAISDEAAALIDTLTAAALRCKAVPVEVASHTDNGGDPEVDRERSKKRASAVVDRFVKAGADSFHVWPMGYGSERPIAPNDSDESRARNWRIEFNVK
ncbi:OmpA family protein [Methylocystis parvus]|nr:OmpA family protein [Methylocystis parvus]WBK01464.1 OmpA family protein [Methylocystis parvus OBBP]